MLVERSIGLSPRGRGNPIIALGPDGGVRSIPARAGEPVRTYTGRRTKEVYPRAGGGTVRSLWEAVTGAGLSPRGRGNLQARARATKLARSIPARAGEPTCWGPPAPGSRVYPRAGGGTASGSERTERQRGLSPRGRGNPGHVPVPHGRGGSIPARAGEPTCWGPPAPGSRVYPRAGGGTASGSERTERQRGLSPRGRGNPGHVPVPHGRGGSIPARAGEPPAGSAISSILGVYPRAGGGTGVPSFVLALMMGLSPRGRGNRGAIAGVGRGRRSIPARAGEPPRTLPPRSRSAVYPRAGGGTRTLPPAPASRSGLSPRGRGNRPVRLDGHDARRSIPARAGEPSRAPSRAAVPGVYPRAGGGTTILASGAGSVSGLSPRGRGNRFPPRAMLIVGGSIPARAGEPTTAGPTSVSLKVYPRAGGGTNTD